MGYVYINSLVAPASPKHGVKFLQTPFPGEGAPAEEDLTDARVVEMCCRLAQAGTSVVVGPLVLAFWWISSQATSGIDLVYLLRWDPPVSAYLDTGYPAAS